MVSQIENKSNVQLFSTNNTLRSIRCDAKAKSTNALPRGTGFRSPALGTAASKAEITVTGKDGLEIEKVNDAGELYTLHGVTGRGFPNLYWTGPFQAGVCSAAYNTSLRHLMIRHLLTCNLRSGRQPQTTPFCSIS